MKLFLGSFNCDYHTDCFNGYKGTLKSFLQLRNYVNNFNCIRIGF